MNLTEDQLRDRFERRVRPEVFRGAQRQAQPVTILLGGQPGAGKSRAGEVAVEAAGGSVVPIVGDDYRQHHPDYRRVMTEDPLRMPDVTAQAAGRWIQMCVDHAREQGYSILIEGTWRNAQVPLEGARLAREDGRRVEAVVVAVQPEVSRLGAMERYYRDVMAGRDARWTPPAAHDAAVASLPGTVEAVALSRDVDTLRVVTRQGATLFHSEEPASAQRAKGAVEALHEGMTRPLAPAELDRYLTSVADMEAAHLRLTSTDPRAREAWTQIKTHDEPLMSARTAAELARIAQPNDPSAGLGQSRGNDPRPARRSAADRGREGGREP